ncbi:MAG TPA: MoaD/ThiS family protein [Jatrophihabitantaceae bacterium]|nr:MoaD/ThiS family protein [Jatrophihabitantaceae bacterium]
MAATIRFWAGARRAAGHAEEPTQAPTLAALRSELAARPGLADVVAASSFLVDGQSVADDLPLPPAATIDVLPPFAGG